MGKNYYYSSSKGRSEVQGLCHLEEEPLLHSIRREDSEEQTLPNRKVHLSGWFRRAHQGGVQMGSTITTHSTGKLRKKAGRITWKGKVLLQPKERHPVYPSLLF